MKTTLCAIGALLAATAGFAEPVDTQFKFDRPAAIEWVTGERVEIEWNEVIDSRCAIGATCVWEGQVTVSIDVVVDGVRNEDVEITLHGEEFERAVATVEGFRIQLAAVGPYPVLDVETERSRYVATVVVSPVTPTEELHGVAALNTEWHLEAFGRIGAEEPTLPGTDVTINFDVSVEGVGSAWGTGGCNGFTGTVQAAPIGAIALSDLGFTDMACGDPAGVMEQEDRFFTELPNVIGFTMDEARLVLPFAGADDVVGTMIFSRMTAPTAVESASWGQVKKLDRLDR